MPAWLLPTLFPNNNIPLIKCQNFYNYTMRILPFRKSGKFCLTGRQVRARATVHVQNDSWKKLSLHLENSAHMSQSPLLYAMAFLRDRRMEVFPTYFNDDNNILIYFLMLLGRKGQIVSEHRTECLSSFFFPFLIHRSTYIMRILLL